MRNHNEKTRDMARSVLPSTARKGARAARAQAHGRERARLRSELHAVRHLNEPDDFEGDLTWTARREIEEMVDGRRAADKVGPLIARAERIVERDPVLSSAPPGDREVHFRKVLPPGLIGDDAISHLHWVFNDGHERWTRIRARTESAPSRDVEIVEAIIAAGRHGDLNRRLRSTLSRVVVHTVRLSPIRVIDDDHPAPGLLHPRGAAHACASGCGSPDGGPPGSNPARDRSHGGVAVADAVASAGLSLQVPACAIGV